MILEPQLFRVDDYSQITELGIVVIFENDLVLSVRKRWQYSRGPRRRTAVARKGPNGVATISGNQILIFGSFYIPGVPNGVEHNLSRCFDLTNDLGTLTGSVYFFESEDRLIGSGDDREWPGLQCSFQAIKNLVGFSVRTMFHREFGWIGSRGRLGKTWGLGWDRGGIPSI